MTFLGGSARRLALCGAVLAACSSPPTSDGGTDTGAPPSCSELADYEVGDASGAGAPLSVSAGAASAGRVSADELPVDPNDLADYRDGDFVLANENIVVLVSDEDGPGQSYDPYGGRIVGLAPNSGGAIGDPADFNLILIGISRFLVATEHVGVLRDGSDGGAAVVRAAGRLAPIEALGGILAQLAPPDFTGLPAAIDYELAPGAEYVDVFLSVRAGERGVSAPLGAIQLFFQGFRTQAWVRGDGFARRTEPPSFIAFDGDDRTSFAWLAPEGTLSPLFEGQGADLLTTGFVGFSPCEEGRLHLGRVVVGGPGLPGVQRAIAALDSTATVTIDGRVEEADGTPTDDVRLHVTAEGGTEHLTRFRPAADGTFSVEVDARADRLVAYREGSPLTEVVLGASSAVVTLPPRGTLEVRAIDSSTLAGVPTRVEVFPEAELPSVPDSFGEMPPGRGRSRLDFPVDGHSLLPLPVGSYRVEVSRGPEYERIVEDVSIAAGETTTVDATLERVVDTTGVLCADFHIHSHRSVDSSDPGSLKVRGLAADGLEIAVRSEHEWVSDYAPVVESLGLGAHVLGLAGIELTTFTYGHFGVFPLTPDPTLPSGGAPVWANRSAPQVFSEVRSRAEAPVLIINHPRAGGLNQGYFSSAGFDPVTGEVSSPELWDDTFQVIEAFNSGDFEGNRDGTVADWFSLLSQGRQVFVVGSSDSHVIAETPVGYPRTCLYLGTDDPTETDGAAVRDAVRAGRAYVSGGIYLEVVGPGGTGPGQTATGVGAVADVTVTVRAASHVSVSRLEVIVDGVTTETIDVLPDFDPLDPTLRIVAPLEVDVASGGSYVVVHAASDTPFDTSGNRPFAVSNPIFLTR